MVGRSWFMVENRYGCCSFSTRESLILMFVSFIGFCIFTSVESFTVEILLDTEIVIT